MAPSPPAVSIIAPTFHEAQNLRPLAERIFAALGRAGRDAELIVVDDDSRDGTEEVVAELSRIHPTRLIVRRDTRGLSSAVIEGFRHARFDRFVVIDADLQHPPEAIPQLLDRLEEHDRDFVIGTRYAPGGRVVEDWPRYRRLVSRVAGLLARPLTPLSDPMSGFFAIRRETWQRARGLNPIGYKIALELYVKCGCSSPGEVPITFDTRRAGTSKLTLMEQLRYARQLAGLYAFRFPWAIAAAGLAVIAVITILVSMLVTVHGVANP